MFEHNYVILKFIENIKSRYPEIKMRVIYLIGDNVYNVYHNSKKLDVGDEDYRRYVGGQIRNILFKNEVFNACICFDEEKVINKERGYVMCDSYLYEYIDKEISEETIYVVYEENSFGKDVRTTMLIKEVNQDLKLTIG